MPDLLRAMSAVLLTWSGLGLAFLGIGLLVRRCFGLRPERTEHLFASFWVGWVFLLVVLQVWHLCFPVGWPALILVTALGAAGLLSSVPYLCSLPRKATAQSLALLGFWLIAAALLANRAIGPPVNYDSGLYHFSSVRWAASYPIVPGLANLNRLLGYNSPYFLYVAMLETGPWVGRSYHLANGLLVLVLLMQITRSGFHVFREQGALRLYHLFLVLLLAPTLRHALGIHLSSPTPDSSIFVLGVVLCAELLAFIVHDQATREESRFALLGLVALACAGCTIKLSFAGLGGAASLAALVLWWVRNSRTHPHRPARTMPYVLLVVTITVAPWMIRGFVLSGYPAFPWPVGSIPVGWRVPHQTAVEASNWVRSWARLPGAHWSKVLSNWAWLKPWSSTVIAREFDVLLPLGLGMLAGLLVAFSRLTGRLEPGFSRRYAVVLLPPLASLIFWFVTAPDVRYAGACFWVLGIAVVSLAAEGIRILGRGTRTLLTLALALVLALLPLRHAALLGPGADRGFHPARRITVQEFTTRSGLILFAPTQSDQCWDAPLPCTPYLKMDLCLRQEGDMSRGFRLCSSSPTRVADR